MTPSELVTLLTPYVGRACRISSTVSSVAWRANQWPTLTEVKQVAQAVWLHYDDGYSYEVSSSGLTIELEPCLGSYDFALAADRMEAIATAIRRYGPTNVEKRGRCDCAVCGAEYARTDARREDDWRALEAERDALPGQPPSAPPHAAPNGDPRPEDDRGPRGGPDLSGF